MNVRDILLANLDAAYDKRGWHGTTLRGSLRGLTPDDVYRRPAKGRHTIWELVAHAAYWKYAVRRRLTGGKRGSFSLKGSNWYEAPPRAGERAWRDVVERHHPALDWRGRTLYRRRRRRVRSRDPDRRRAGAGEDVVDVGRDLRQRLHGRELLGLQTREIGNALTGRSEDLDALDGVDAEIRLELHAKVERFTRIAGLLGDDVEEQIGARCRRHGARHRRGDDSRRDWYRAHTGSARRIIRLP